MARYKLTLEYDGTDFVGWQRQAEGVSVQSALEEAIAGFCGQTCLTVAAGRTDAGVHALGQVAHVDLPTTYPDHTVRDAINAHLRPAPIVVVAAVPVGDDFHARFSATARHYRYCLINRSAPLAIARRHAWWVPRALDISAMQRAARHLVGRHDFTSFRAAQCQAKSPLKTLDRLVVYRDGDAILVEADARSFLHHQVRNIVGSLKHVGDGRDSADWMKAVLEARDRRAAAETAPARGLFLTGVDYELGR